MSTIPAFGIPFVEKVGKGGKFVALKAACVHVVHDGDEPHARFGVDDFGSQLVKQMAAQEGITEQFKADEQMEWISRMNNIRNRAMEIVDAELIFAQ